MKKLVFAFAAVMVLVFTSCGKKRVVPVSEKIDGPLGSFFEVVSQPYQIDETGLVTFNLKRVNEGLPEPWTKELALGIGDNTYEPVFKVAFLDKGGNTFMRSETQIEADEACLNKLMGLQVGETAPISFKTDAEKAQKVKFGSDFVVRIPTNINLSGTIGHKNAVYMTLQIASSGEVKGAYYYKSQGPKALLYLKGRKQDASLSLLEYNKKGDHTGVFKGTLNDNVYHAEFESFTHDKYDITLEEDNDMNTIDFSQTDFNVFLKKEFYIPKAYTYNYQDWQVFLERYEKVVNNYIAQKKRFEDGEEDAAIEMASALADFEALTDVLKRSYGFDGRDQAERYEELQQRMKKAMN